MRQPSLLTLFQHLGWFACSCISASKRVFVHTFIPSFPPREGSFTLSQGFTELPHHSTSLLPPSLLSLFCRVDGLFISRPTTPPPTSLSPATWIYDEHLRFSRVLEGSANKLEQRSGLLRAEFPDVCQTFSPKTCENDNIVLNLFSGHRHGKCDGVFLWRSSRASLLL